MIRTRVVANVLIGAGIVSACGSEAGTVAQSKSEREEQSDSGSVTSATDRSASLAEEAEIMRDLGFVKADQAWADPECGESHVELDQLTDLNGDGRREAVIRADGDQCYGFNQRQATIYEKVSGKWREVVSYQAEFMVDSWHERSGIAWPDIEYFPGMSGEQRPDGSIGPAACVPFLRWNGKDYVDGGTSRDGRICQLDAAFAGGKEAAAGPFPPLPAGFYAVSDTCIEAAKPGGQYLYFDAKNWNEIDGQSRIQAIRPMGGSRWAIEMDGGPGLTIEVTGPSSFSEYGRMMTHCPTSSVSATAREGYLPQ